MSTLLRSLLCLSNVLLLDIYIPVHQLKDAAVSIFVRACSQLSEYTQRIQLVGSMVTQCFLFWGMTKLYTATSQVWRIGVFMSLLVLAVAHHCECVYMCMHRTVSVCVPMDIYMEDMVSPSILFCFAEESISPLKWRAAILGTSLSKLLVSACFHSSMLGDWHAQLCLSFYVT